MHTTKDGTKLLCHCSDSACPHCRGTCKNISTGQLYRVDMEDEEGTAFCEECGNDAMSSGVFTDSVKVCDYCENRAGKYGEIRECGYLKDPWSDEEYTHELCDDCHINGRGEEWDTCQVCDREIACTASNGMRSYFTYLFSENENDETRMEAYGMRESGGICTKCLQGHRMKNGLLPCEIVDGEPLHADFYNYDELRKAGYELHEEGGHFCKRNEDRDNVNKTMRELVAAGYDVILDLEASGMGLEGYVGIWKRKHVDATQSQA